MKVEREGGRWRDGEKGGRGDGCITSLLRYCSFMGFVVIPIFFQ